MYSTLNEFHWCRLVNTSGTQVILYLIYLKYRVNNIMNFFSDLIMLEGQLLEAHAGISQLKQNNADIEESLYASRAGIIYSRGILSYVNLIK